MRIDDHAFEQTAKAVYIMNESAQKYYDNWQELQEFMISMAYQYGHNSNSFSTGGFQLTFAKSSVDKDEIFVTASVQAYTALKYAEAVAGKLDSIRSLAA